MGDAGGRNCSISLGSRNGFTQMTSAVGMVLWLQHWHWYPMMHTFGLVLTPTYSIGLNKDFKFPKSFAIVCSSKPSVFAYPKKLEEKKEEKKKREPEPSSYKVSNPSRVTTSQSLICEFDLTQRYRPIRVEEKPFGVIIL